MKNECLSEIRELKAAIAVVIGSSDLPSKEQFSQDALNSAAKEFQKMSIERGEWVSEYDISKYIKNAGYRAGAFIRQEFSFSNYFKRGKQFYYNKKDLIALGNELKQRNVDLGRYMELLEDKAKFRKYLESAALNNKGKRKGKPFTLSGEVNNVTSSPPPMPNAEIIREDLKRLKEEFFQYKLSDYVDIYSENHAMMKFIYYFEKYIDPQLKKRCKKWCEDFNYANNALEKVTKKKEAFIPVKEDDMIQL